MTVFLLCVALFFSIFLVLVFGQILLSVITIGFYQGPYYSPTDSQRLKNILNLANLSKKDNAIDLGAGDGRIVAAMAKTGARAEGIEINPLYYFRARRLLNKHRLSSSLARIIWGDFWTHNLTQYNVVVIYGISYMMSRLERKLAKELKPGTRVISVYFKFPHWQIIKEKGDVRYYLVPDSFPKEK